MSEACLVLSACAVADARRLARGLVENRLAACVSRVDTVSSTYRWNDKLMEDTETLLLIKTQQDRLPALTEWLTAEHGYDVPEIISVPINGGHQPYLDWLQHETQTAGD